MLDLNYTSEMEKAMHQSHGIGYAEYAQKHEKRMDVELRREADYQKSQLIYAEINRRLKN